MCDVRRLSRIDELAHPGRGSSVGVSSTLQAFLRVCVKIAEPLSVEVRCSGRTLAAGTTRLDIHECVGGLSDSGEQLKRRQ